MSDTVHPRTEALYRRVEEAADASGRLPLPDVTTWEIFPFEGDLAVKRLEPPVLPEPPRHGEGGVDCGSCAAGTTGAVWYDDRWKLVAPDEPLAVPAVLLCPIAHHDLEDLDWVLAREMGFLIWRVERALRSIGGIGRVHVNRWGDGGAHLHIWFFARPEGVLQLRGSSLSDWTDCLPPMPAWEWQATMAAVAEDMTVLGGTAQAR
jgi:hypothetical protein